VVKSAIFFIPPFFSFFLCLGAPFDIPIWAFGGYSPEKGNGSGAAAERICDFVGLETRRQRSAVRSRDICCIRAGVFSGNCPISAKISGTFPDFAGTFFGFLHFDRKKFGIFNFRAKNFWARELSTGIFLDFSTFEPKKIPGNSDPGRSRSDRFTTEK
jgi:hypothetical protein